MSKPSKNSSQIVFSTDAGRYCSGCRRPIGECVCKNPPSPAGNNDGVVRVRRETKGRGGKAVTVITGLPLQGEDLKKLARELKRVCGTGGAIKEGAVEIQGDKRETCQRLLAAKGYTVKLAGG